MILLTRKAPVRSVLLPLRKSSLCVVPIHLLPRELVKACNQQRQLIMARVCVAWASDSVSTRLSRSLLVILPCLNSDQAQAPTSLCLVGLRLWLISTDTTRQYRQTIAQSHSAKCSRALGILSYRSACSISDTSPRLLTPFLFHTKRRDQAPITPP